MSTPDLLVSGTRALARALRWLGLASLAALLVYLFEVSHGARGLTLPGMASVALVLALAVTAGVTFALASTEPRNPLIRAACPLFVGVGAVFFLTGSPEASARRYFELHREELDALAWELRRERPFRGSLAEAGPFEGRESLRSRVEALGAGDVRLEAGRTVLVHLLHLDGYHGFVQVGAGGEPPRRGEAFRPGVEHLSYREIRPLDGGWHYFQVLEVPATRPAAGRASEPPAPPAGAGAEEASGPPPPAPPTATGVEPSPEARAFFAERHAALDTLIWEFGRGPIWHGRLEDVRGLEPERRARLLERVGELGFREAFLESGRVVFVRDGELSGDTLRGVLWVAGSAPVPPRGGPLLAGYRFHRVALLGRFETHELHPMDGTWHAVRFTRLPEPWWTRQRTPPSSRDDGG